MAQRFQHGLMTFALALGLISSPEAFASTLDLFGYGARGTAMAGAIATTARGHAAVYYNPAALALNEKPSFSVGYQHAALNLNVNGNPHEVRDAPALVFGFGVPLPFGGVLEDRISIGFGFVLPEGAILMAQTPAPSQPSFPLLETRAQTLSAQLALGISILDELSIGVGTLALATLEGAIDAGPGPTGKVSARVQDSLVAHFALVVGILVEPRADLSIAATWRGKSLAEYSIPVNAELGSTIEIPIPTLNITGIAQYDPQRATLEVSYVGLDSISLSAAITYRLWSQYRNPIEYPATPDDYPTQPEPGFHDTVVPRLGIEFEFMWSSILVEPRLGYCFEPSPAPEQTGFHNYLSSNRHIIGSGFGMQYGDFSLDVAAQYHALETRAHNKETSTETASTNPGYPSISHGGNIFLWSTELGVAF